MTLEDVYAKLPEFTAEGLESLRNKVDGMLKRDHRIKDESFSDEDKAELDCSLAEYRRTPDAVWSWEEVWIEVLTQHPK